MKKRLNRPLISWLNNTANRPRQALILAMLWLLLVGIVAFFWHLGSISLIDETEPLFAEAARQMKITGDWITPFFNGETRFDKPPLIYWLMALFYHVVGVNEWAVRLPSALAAMSLVGLGFYTIWLFGLHTSAPMVQFEHRRYWLSASLGAAIIALNPETIVWARTGVSDMLLSGCMGSALLCWFCGYANSLPKIKLRWYVAFYILIGLAILTKGPVGIVLPGLIIGSFLFYVGKLREVLLEMHLVVGGLIISAVSLPWFILVIARNGNDYINSFFGYHNLERFTGVVNRHSAPWYYYFVVVLLGFAPWSIYLPVAITKIKLQARSHWQKQERGYQLSLFALFWFLGIFGFFTIAVTKLPSYVLPLMPASALLVALPWSEPIPYQPSWKYRRFFYISRWLNVGLVLILAVAMFLAPGLVGVDPAIPNLRQLVEQSGLPVIGGAIWAVCGIGGATLLLSRQGQWLLKLNIVAFIAFVIFVMMPAAFLMDEARQVPLKELSAIASSNHVANEELVMIGFKKPSVVFYSQLPVTYIKETNAGINYIDKLLTTKSASFSAMVLAQPKKLVKLETPAFNSQQLGEAGAYRLIRVTK
ncbi:ArnT family glycosyltransferase [Synechocystis sp. PCC 7509]|uniref:ArnT family glycosyltransferase n=1 Tax=Synechocystis sp. PCC 7509 TaxID=927677 RepID=UPI0002AC412E|nr:glycosyltransferase family 39 protein [Synechocystis sp. PCC 7509]